MTTGLGGQEIGDWVGKLGSFVCVCVCFGAGIWGVGFGLVRIRALLCAMMRAGRLHVAFTLRPSSIPYDAGDERQAGATHQLVPF